MAKTISPAERIAKLREELHRHNHLYYVEAAPVISDLEYDRMMKDLEALEKAHPTLASPDSPTQRVGGAPVGSLKTVAHKVPMLSIDNAYNVEEVREFDAKVRKELRVPKVRYVVEPKIDGASLSLVYKDGVLDVAVTRGDGERGDDVTHNVKTAGGVPLKLRTKTPPPHFEARGEIYMTKADFAARNAALKEVGEKEAANPRNLAAGSLRLLDPKEAATRKLRLFAYTTGLVEGLTLKTQTRTLEVLKEFGFHVTPDITFCEDVEAVVACCEKWAERRFELGYDIDGLVIKIDDLSSRERLGTTAKHVKWAIAYKFEAEQGITKLLDIEISVGKYGEHTPVALLAPVHLCGTTVQRASLHNAVQVKEKDIRIGDTVIVVKKGEIIPYVVRPLTELRTGEQKPYKFPTKCVACGAPTRFDEAVDNVPFCTATHTCPHQLRKRLESYAKRERMDIEGLGRETCDVLVASGLVKTVADLYLLTEEKLLGLPRMGKLSAQKLLKGIEASKDRGLGRLLGGLSIPRVGEEMGPTLAEVFPSLDAILAAPVEDLAGVSGFGPIRAASIKTYFGSAEGQKLVAGLRAAGVKLTEDAKVRTSPAILAGKTVVTGALVKYKRTDIEAKLADMGAKVGSGVSKNTDLLIVGADAGSKLDKAKALGVKTITEDEFETMVNELLASAPPVVAPVAHAPTPVAHAPGSPGTGSLAGKTVCVTGELSRKRKEVEALIVQKGGEVSSSVTKAVNLVVAGDAAGTKLEKAKALGIQVIDEAAFDKLVGK